MGLTLINDFNESRMYRSKTAIKRVDARQVADHAFMDMIALWILYNEFEFSPTAMDYAQRTVTFNRFTEYRHSGTDLYINLHLLIAKPADLLPSETDAALLGKVSIDSPGVVRYLRQLVNNNLDRGRTRMTLQRLEHSLHIDNSNYRSVRRLAQNWPNLATGQKRLVLTRMLMFYRTHARRSSMYQHLSELAKFKNLEVNATNPETSIAAKVATGAAAAAAGAVGGYHLGKSSV